MTRSGEAAPVNVLFLCTGNSARSVLAEAILNREGAGRFRAFSAGSHPKGEVNPYALELLRSLDFPVGELRSKSWSEFSDPGAPPLDCVITVCDNAAGKSCPLWRGSPVVAHWGLPDPAAAKGSDDQVRQAFAETYRLLLERIRALIAQPRGRLDPGTLHRLHDEAGGGTGAPARREPATAP